MAKDLGVAPASLFLVKQPWVVHLDMAMALLAPGVVVPNDALEAFRLQTRWLREAYEASRPRRETSGSDAQYRRDLELWRWAGRDLEERIQKMWRYTKRFARFEARALGGLEPAGLTVLRVPGRFLHPTRPWDRDIMNLGASSGLGKLVGVVRDLLGKPTQCCVRGGMMRAMGFGFA